MKDDKITITYTTSEEHKFACYPPHSKTNLIKNLWNLFLAVLWCLMFLWCIEPIMSKQPHDWAYYTTLVLVSMFPLVPIVTAIEEWINGNGYKTAKKLIAKHTTKEEREKAMKKLNILSDAKEKADASIAKEIIVNPSEGNCIDKNGNHYIKNLPNTPKDKIKY